jgi:hypothetical protein
MIKLALVVLVCAATVCGQDHPEAKLRRVTTETDDAIAFQISVRKFIYAENEDIDVDYVVQNNGRKTVYLVIEPVDVRLTDEWMVELSDPVQLPDGHDRFLHKFVRIAPGKSYRGKRTITAKQLNDHPKYGFDVVEIRAKFSYLFDISDLEGCEQYGLPCLREVYDRSKAVTIGHLVVERKVE